jgi:CO/xanthine dehydrogenase Mo-binding subunit
MEATRLSGKAVGQPVQRVDGVAKVTGRARYAGDVELPGMLFGRCLRSPHASARIVSIDVRRAKALPGVHAVLPGADVPDTRYGRTCQDIPLLAKGVTRFVGEKVAAVAADTVEIAEAALELMDVEYAELPAVFSPEDAMRPTAPVIHPEAVEILPGAATRSHGELSMYPPIPNVISQFKVRHGDVARAFATAHKIFEHHFAVPSVHQGYIEPHTCLVSIGTDGLVDVWVANKGPHIARAHMAGAIGVPEHRIRFNPVAIGGDFGGKGSLMDTLLCYHLARAADRPVKMVMNSFEELTAGNPRHSASITLRTGIDPATRCLWLPQISYRSQMHGIAFELKDIYCTAEIRARTPASYVPDLHETPVTKLQQAGAILLGKLMTHEFAYGRRHSTFPSRMPETHGPRAPHRSSDTGGSIQELAAVWPDQFETDYRRVSRCRAYTNTISYDTPDR